MLLAAVATVAAVLTGAPSATAADGTSGRLWDAYARAIRDSSVAQSREVVTDLVVPVAGSPLVQWKDIDGEPHLLVGLARFAPLTEVALGTEFALTGNRWVFIPREIKRECAKAGCDEMGPKRLDLRMKQLLGLPPDADYGSITTFWVRPADLFRPCTDPRVDAASCPEQVPADAPATVGPVSLDAFLWRQANDAWRLPARAAKPISCAADFANATGGNCAGYPWTRLGYTYDWAPGAKDERGVTEFVAVKGASVVLESVGGQLDFFGS